MKTSEQTLRSIDIKAELLLWKWVEEGVLPEDIIVHPVGAFRRGFSQDVERIWQEESGLNNTRQQLHIEVNRDGLYDALPEGLFHQPGRRNPHRSVKEVVEEIKLQHAREAAARTFFLPVEQEFYRLRLQLIQEEQKQYFHSPDSAANEALINFWQIPDFFDSRQMHYLFHLLPLIHRFAGNSVATAQLLQLFVDDEVSLRFTENIPFEIDDQLLPRLGHTQLGIDALLGGQYPERVVTAEIQVSLQEDALLNDYLPGNRKWFILNYLANYLLPCELEIDIQIVIAQPYHFFSLSETESAGRLGYTSCL